MAINYLIHRILLAVFLLTGIDPFAVFAAAGDLADDRAIILGVLDNDAQADSVAIVFTETDIIPLGAGGECNCPAWFKPRRVVLPLQGDRNLFD